jgi:hypothetical protein
MKTFFDELRIVPRVVWPIALLIALSSGVLWVYFWRPQGQSFSRGEIFFLVWSVLFLFAWVVLIGYVHGDARQRGMRHVMWTLLAIFIPNFIGAILYFFLRDPLLIACPKCGTRGKSIFVFCPQCGAEFVPSCPACKRAVEPAWQRCAYCGNVLAQQTPVFIP